LVHGRWFDFAIRLQGNFLTRRIERDNASYSRALDRFDKVRADLAAELDKLAEKARAKLREYSVGLEDGQARAKAYFSDLFQQFESACDQFNLELVPYGHALREMATKKLEMHLQALATDPLKQVHA
jgi:hypothetical protein